MNCIHHSKNSMSVRNAEFRTHRRPILVSIYRVKSEHGSSPKMLTRGKYRTQQSLDGVLTPIVSSFSKDIYTLYTPPGVDGRFI
jgi:hypothetical protein